MTAKFGVPGAPRYDLVIDFRVAQRPDDTARLVSRDVMGLALGAHVRDRRRTAAKLARKLNAFLQMGRLAFSTTRRAMKPVLLTLCLLSPTALACESDHDLALSGTATVETCPKESADCVFSGNVLHPYFEAVPDDPTVMTVALQSSPWRLYDGDMRILTIEELAEVVRGSRDATETRVELIGSWTGVSPSPGVPSLADRLSKALDGFPVRGEDGFLWVKADGTRRTTRQAYTAREGAGSYYVPKGGEVMTALAGGWPAFVEDRIPDDQPELLMRAAAGWDMFFLCPDKALAGFERAATKGSAIAAYNAAVMRLERSGEANRAAALVLLERGATLGDAKSKARLEAERG